MGHNILILTLLQYNLFVSEWFPSHDPSQNYNTDLTGMFAAPCGLIKIVLNSTGVLPQNPADLGDAPFSIWCKLTLSAGHYQGIAAQPMQEVN